MQLFFIQSLVEEVYRHLRFVEEVVCCCFSKGEVSILFVMNFVLPFLRSLLFQNECLNEQSW